MMTKPSYVTLCNIWNLSRIGLWLHMYIHTYVTLRFYGFWHMYDFFKSYPFEKDIKLIRRIELIATSEITIVQMIYLNSMYITRFETKIKLL
jgi:hypothetical protein